MYYYCAYKPQEPYGFYLEGCLELGSVCKLLDSSVCFLLYWWGVWSLLEEF